MELIFQLLDCDYTLVNGTPVIRLFGKTKDNETVCIFHKGYKPYFYIVPKDEVAKVSLIELFKSKFGTEVSNITEVEKFLPIGFQDKKTKMLKITLNDPSKVPEVRDYITKQSSVVGVYEADILFKYRFMADSNISGLKWYKAIGNGVKTTTVKVNKALEAEKIQEADELNTTLKYVAIDIEIAAGGETLVDPKKDPIAIISLSFSPPYNGRDSLVLLSKPSKRTYNDVMVFKDEVEMLKEFVKIIDLFDPDVIAGYNINSFDFPYILERLIQCNVSRTLGRCRKKPALSKKIGAKFKNSLVGRVIVDVYEMIKESVGKGFLRLKRYGLGDVSRELLNEEKIDITHGDISKYWNGTEDQFKKLIEYARKDARLVLELLLRKSMLDKYIEISKVSGLLLQDVLDGGEATRVENLLLKEFNRVDYVLPLKPTDDEILKRKQERETMGLKGALVLEPDINLHTNAIVYLDFKAMYPSIFIAYNICPTTLVLTKQMTSMITTPYGTKFVSKETREGILPKIVKYLIRERDRVKKQMRQSTDVLEKRNLDAKQFALKTMANAFYGYTGYIRARLYILDIANAITSCGRLLIQKTRDIVESNSRVKVIYGDTDSIMVKTPTKNLEEAFSVGKEIEAKINKELSGIVEMKIESVFKSLLVLSKKRYAGLSMDRENGTWVEKTIMKGIETVRRDWCDLTSETLFNVLEIILKEQNPKKALDYVRSVINELEKNQIPVEKLVITKSVSKPLRDYKGIQPHIELVKKIKRRNPAETPAIGDRIGFVIIDGLQLMSDRAEDPAYVKQHGLKIDSRYYIESQLLPPLERVFEAIGITKSELVSMGKQLVLTDAFRTIKKPEKQILNSIDGFVCDRCNKTFRRVPLIGKCYDCGGEIMFYSGGIKSMYADV